MADEVYATVTETLKKFESTLTAAGIKNPDQLTAAIDAEYKDLRYSEVYEEDLETGKTKAVYQDHETTENRLLSELKEFADITRKNKEAVLKAITFGNQYFHPDGGFKTPNTPQKMIGGVSIEDLYTPRNLNQEQLFDRAPEDIDVDTVIKEMGSSGHSDLSLDPADYTLSGEINRETVIDTYDSIKNNGAKKDTPVHDRHLKSLLSSLVQNVINPLDLYTKFSTTQETEGKFVEMDGARNRVFLNLHSGVLNQGIQMSAGEVYTHELVHAVIHYGLDANKALYDKVNRLYGVVYKKITKEHPGEEFKAFLPSGVDITDPANQEIVEMAKAQFKYVFHNAGTHGGQEENPYTGVTVNKVRSNHIDEFMAFALTNEAFGQYTQNISLGDTAYAKTSWKGIRGANIQETLLNIFQLVLDFFYGRFTKMNEKTAYAEIEQLAQSLAKINSEYKTKRFAVLRKLAGISGKLQETGNSFIKDSVKKVSNIANWKEGFDILVDDPSKGGQILRDTIYKLQSLDQGIIKTTAQEAWGMTKRLSHYYQLLTRRNRLLDSTKEAAAHAYSKLANSFFKEELSAEQKILITKAGLKVDATVLLDALGVDRLLEIYQDTHVCDAEINKILTTLADTEKFPEASKHAGYYQRAAQASGEFLVHSQSSQEDHVFLNAALIAELKDSPYDFRVVGKEATSATKLIDQMISLYAIKALSIQNRQEFAGFLEQNKKGVTKTLQLHKLLKENAKEVLFDGNKYQFIKGYTKTILNPEIDITFGTIENEAELTQLGYTRSEQEISRDFADPHKKQKMYVYTAKMGRINTLQSGILSTTRNRAKGTEFRLISEQFDSTLAQGLKNTQQLKKAKYAVYKQMLKGGTRKNSKLSNPMVAKVDSFGKIIEYRYMMSEKIKESYLDQVNDFDAILGGMASQIIDKGVTPQINEELILSLRDTYEERYHENPAEFVQIGPNAEDPKMVEQYYLIPEKTRQFIKRSWRMNGTMYVPKELMTLVFGYRKYGLVESFTKKPAERNRLEAMVVSLINHIVKDATGETGRGIKAANTAERLAIEMAQYAKDNIIVKSLTVTLGNFGSNLIYLRMRGVPITTTLKHGWDAIKYGTQFQAESLKANTLQIEANLLEKSTDPEDKKRLKIVKRELMLIKDSLARNPVLDSINAGLMPSLVDEVDTQGQQNFFPGTIEKTIKKHTKKLPEPIKAAGKILFLAQDTEAYKVLNNGVKLTDFVGRHVLYNHYVKSLKMGPKEAAEKAIEEFINFDIPSHRMIEYANEIGLFWFTTYAIRIPMIALRAIKDKPFSSGLAYLTSMHTGLDNITDSIIPEIGYKLGTPPTSLVGSMDGFSNHAGNRSSLGYYFTLIRELTNVLIYFINIQIT